MATITIYTPEQDPITLDLADNDEITIGRDPGNEVVIDHDSISGKHAVLRKVADSHVLYDLDSTNGLYLENNPVTEAPLSHGANFHVGHVPIQYAAAGQEVAEPNAAAGGFTTEGFGAPVAAFPEASVKPAGFKDMSPIKKVEKPDTLANLAKIVGWLAIATAAALIFTAFIM